MIDTARFWQRLTLKPIGVEGCNILLAQWDKRTPDRDRRWLAYMLATTYHETATKMAPIEEYGHGAGRDYGRPDAETGQIYYGRGYVQLTWKSNYDTMGRRLGLDLLNKPELALDPAVAADILFDGMAYGIFTGVGLARYFNDKVDDPIDARRIINGTDCAELIAGYHADFLTALT